MDMAVIERAPSKAAYPIPDVALDDRLGWIGTAGSGKTYNAGGGVERLLESGARVVIVDPLDVWWGLRLTADGKPSKFTLPIFGGEHGDLPLNEHAGKLIGETVAGVAESCIVSLGGLDTKAAERRFMLAFLEAIYRHASFNPVHLIFDEADLWAPQKALEPKLQALMEQIVRRGRVRGFIPWLITQRPAVISKDVLSQVDGLIAFKLTASQDRDALGAWIEGQADKQQGKEILASLPTMQRGQGVVWVPARGILETVGFPPKRTFDSSRTPSRGEVVEKRALKPLDLDKLKGKLASLEEEQRASDPAKLKAEVARLTRELAKAQKAVAAPPKPEIVHANADEIEAARQEGVAMGLRQAQEAIAALGGGKMPASRQKRPAPIVSASIAQPAPARGAPSSGGSHLPPGERAVLIAAVQYGGVDRDQLSVLTGYKRSSRDAYIARLRDKGLVEVSGQTISPTDDAVAALGSDYEPLPTGAKLRDYWMQRLPSGEAAVLGVLTEVYPQPLARSELDDRTGYKRSSRDAYIQRLKARRLVNVSGADVVASETLFN